jgi:hypothetical protein
MNLRLYTVFLYYLCTLYILYYIYLYALSVCNSALHGDRSAACCDKCKNFESVNSNISQPSNYSEHQVQQIHYVIWA